MGKDARLRRSLSSTPQSPYPDEIVFFQARVPRPHPHRILTRAFTETVRRELECVGTVSAPDAGVNLGISRATDATDAHTRLVWLCLQRCRRSSRRLDRAAYILVWAVVPR